MLVAGFGVRGPAARRARRCPPHRRARRVVRAIGRRAMARGRGLTAPSGLLVVRRPRVVLALDRGRSAVRATRAPPSRTLAARAGVASLARGVRRPRACASRVNASTLAVAGSNTPACARRDALTAVYGVPARPRGRHGSAGGNSTGAANRVNVPLPSGERKSRVGADDCGCDSSSFPIPAVVVGSAAPPSSRHRRFSRRRHIAARRRTRGGRRTLADARVDGRGVPSGHAAVARALGTMGSSEEQDTERWVAPRRRGRESRRSVLRSGRRATSRARTRARRSRRPCPARRRSVDPRPSA